MIGPRWSRVAWCRTDSRGDAYDEHRECIPHRGCCRIVMLVASGLAPRRQAPDRRCGLDCLQPRGLWLGNDHRPNRAGVCGPVRRTDRFRRAFPLRLAVPKPILGWKGQGSLAGGLPFLLVRRRSLRRSEASFAFRGLPLIGDDCLPFAASAVRGADPKIYLACFPILLRASLPPSFWLNFTVLFQAVRPSSEGAFFRLDGLSLRPVTESCKKNLWRFSTGRRFGSGQGWITCSAARVRANRAIADQPPRCAKSRSRSALSLMKPAASFWS